MALLIQDSIVVKEQNFSPDSLFLDRKSFSFEEDTPPLTQKDTSLTDRKKLFIEGQIKTKIAEQPRQKKRSDTSFSVVKIDSSLGSIVLHEKPGTFRFSDIITRSPLKKTVLPTGQIAYKHFFTDHALIRKHDSPLALNNEGAVWVFFVLLILVAAFAWIRVFYRRTVGQIFNAVWNMSAANQMVRDENLLLQRASVLLTVLFNLVAAFFLYQISMLYDWSSDYIGSGFGRFLIFAFVVSLVYSFKFILLRISGYVFRSDKQVAGYVFNIFLINNVLGILLLPLIIGITFFPSPYSRILIFVSSGIIALGYLYRLLRGLYIGISFSEFSKFHLLLYLCTLEIAPLLVFAHLFFS